MKLNLRSVDLNLLTVFDALMREQNMSRAAERLGMSQPAMSAALQRLRLTLKDELFVRTRQGMVPTPRAQSLYGPLQAALGMIGDTLSTEDRFEPATSTRQFRLLADSYLEIMGLGHLLAELQRQAPGVELLSSPVVDSDVSAALRRLEADVALDYVPVEAGHIASEILSSERLVVIARRDHPRIQGSLSLEQYLAESHVMLPLRSREYTQLESALGGQSLPRLKAATVTHFSAMPAVVSQTEHLATLPGRLAQLYARSFAVQSLPFPVDIEPVPIWMMWPQVLENDAGHRWLRDILRKMALRFSELREFA